MSHPMLREYHDREWGVPGGGDKHHFEHIALEIFQAGLSWLTMLKKRENFRTALSGFDPEQVARFTAADFERLMKDAGIIRNRRKIEAVMHNARPFLQIAEEFNGFWRFAEGFKPEKPAVYGSDSEIPAWTPESAAMSKELKRRGFKFVGPTGCYSYMQGVGVVNDHIRDCFRHEEIEKMNPHSRISFATSRNLA